MNKNGEEIQIVFGPGKVKKAYDSFDSLLISQDFITNDVKYLIGMSVPPIMTAQIATEIYNQWLNKI